MELVVRPLAPMALEFDVSVDGRSAGTFKHRLFARPDQFEIDGVSYRIVRTPGFGLSTERDGVEEARAERFGLFRRGHRVSWSGGEVAFRPAALGVRFDVIDVESGERAGTVRQRSPFTRTLVARLGDVPVPVAVLLIALAERYRRRAAAAG